MESITINVKVLPEKRDEFLQTVRVLYRDIEKEKGFKRSALFQDVDDETRFNLNTTWEKREDLDNYLKSELYKILMGAVKVLGEHHEIHSYTAFREAG